MQEPDINSAEDSDVDWLPHRGGGRYCIPNEHGTHSSHLDVSQRKVHNASLADLIVRPQDVVRSYLVDHFGRRNAKDLPLEDVPQTLVIIENRRPHPLAAAKSLYNFGNVEALFICRSAKVVYVESSK
ncbi:hypothetical protein HMPREF9069_00986 [Atopobium sp. oral taxon 810 str. F0209]|nr:hypothetical protein HMPREF9069_00986 [Atopobium sp. oral taxon 810 str. F0209]